LLFLDHNFLTTNDRKSIKGSKDSYSSIVPNENLSEIRLSSTAMSTHAAQSNVSCSPVKVCGVVKVSYILPTCPYFDNLEFDIFVAGGPQCHFIMSVTIAVRI